MGPRRAIGALCERCVGASPMPPTCLVTYVCGGTMTQDVHVCMRLETTA